MLAKEAKKLKDKFCSGAFLEDMWIWKRNLTKSTMIPLFHPKLEFEMTLCGVNGKKKEWM